MTRSAASKTPYADQRPCTKRTNGLFQAMAQKVRLMKFGFGFY